MNSEKRILKSKGTFIDNVKFDYFVTLAFNNDSHEENESKVVEAFRDIMKQNDEFGFIFVPEEHCNDTLYHGLIKGLKKEVANNLLSELGLSAIQEYDEQNEDKVIKFMTKFLTEEKVTKLWFAS